MSNVSNEVHMAEAPAADASQGLISRSDLDNQINDTVGRALTLNGENFEKKLEERFAKVTTADQALASISYRCFSHMNLVEMKSFARNHRLDMAFHGARDHLDSSMHGYRVFVNPSTSDVVATTTAEALAMGKWVVVQDLPCNRFFSTFSNCLTYKTPEEFSSKLEFAMKHDPHPMKEEERRRLTWEAATERFLDVSELKGEERSPPVSAAIDTLAFNLHNYLTGLEALRAVSGAGVNTRDNPIDIKDFAPSTAAGGFFDDKKRVLSRAAKAAS